MILDENRRELITKNKKIELTFYEYKFIYYLIKNKNRNCTYKELIIYIYSTNEENYKLYKNSFNVLLKKMQRKLEKENLLITTVYNYGVFMTYIVDNKIKKKIKKYENQIKIEQLKQEILEREEKIKLLEKEIL